ncbi:MAG: PrsW family intramembrane metalloprotease [Halobacteriaceae archaeon]
MSGPRDPVQRADPEESDGVVTWSMQSRLDRLSVRLYGWLLTAGRSAVILLAALIIVGQFGLVAIAATDQPTIAVYILLSVVPALAVAGYVWTADVTRSEPLGLLVGTFLLGFLFASFAAVVNSASQGAFQMAGFAGMVAFFYVVVAPVEEAVKLLAVRLYAFRHSDFDAVIDGAVYGAVAGLGFATIENSIYITEHVLQAATVGGSIQSAARDIALIRSFAGPGHVIYSALAGYYLGLAKFNRDDAGPIVVKGLLVAALLHGTYNVSVSVIQGLHGTGLFGGLSVKQTVVGFVVVYDSAIGYLLYRKLSRYRDRYRETVGDRDPSGVDVTEFEPATTVGEADSGDADASGDVASDLPDRPDESSG